MKAGAGGHDIVDQQDALTVEWLLAAKGAAHVFNTCFQRQAGLRRCQLDALAAGVVYRRLQRMRQKPGDFL